MFSRNRDLDMTSGPLFTNILLFSLPIMAMNLLQLLFNAADMIVVGRFAGSQALAAIGATGALINLLVNVFLGLSVGTSVVVAQNHGANKPVDVSRSVHTSIAISIIAGIFVMITGLIFCEPLLKVMGTPQDIIHLSILYMKIYFLGIPAGMVYNFSAAILRAIGDSRRPMYYLTIAGIVNVVLNLFFVIVLKMSVDGVAWATTISQYLAVTLIIICLYRSSGAIRFHPKQMVINKDKLRDIIKIGVPAGLQSLLFSISNVFIQSSLNTFGSTMVAGSSASGNIEGFAATASNAYYNAAITFTGQNMGAKRPDRIDETAKVCTILIFSTWLISGSGILLFGRQLLGLYTKDPQVIDLGMIRLRIMMATYFTCSIMNVYPGLLRGMGYSILPMLNTLIGACLLRIVWLVTVFKWYPTPLVLFMCYPVTWTIAGLAQVASFFYARHQVRKNFMAEAGTDGV